MIACSLLESVYTLNVGAAAKRGNSEMVQVRVLQEPEPMGRVKNGAEKPFPFLRPGVQTQVS
jgi:hypothetical protein